ncbi:MAG: hypothetical protein ACOC58_00165 [Chloroflexota bacterium]
MNDQCPVCGLPLEGHHRCSGCLMLLGPGHIYQDIRDGLCRDCYRWRSQGVPPQGWPPSRLRTADG